jgi:hypothetical protein
MSSAGWAEPLRDSSLVLAASRRMTRLTNALSKKIENHRHAMALHFLYYNFVRVHQTLKDGRWRHKAAAGNEGRG